MISLRVLVLDDRLSRRKIMLEALAQLGVRAVFHASDYEKAVAILHRAQGVDIVLCDLNQHTSACLDFLMSAGQARLLSALVLSAAMEPQLLRAVERISLFSQIKWVSVVDPQQFLPGLAAILSNYIKHKTLALQASHETVRLPSESEVRKGLAEAQFKAWFQPKFDLRDGALQGVEALVRWEHSSRGLLLPREFLPAVLAYDLMDEMFKQVFTQGLALLSALRQRDVHLQVAFNLHASQLANAALTQFIEHQLNEVELPGAALVFEVAENGLLDMPIDTVSSLLRLQLLGCELSVDDFGMGFSSLKLLCELPFNQLKLDGSLIQDLPCYSSQALVSSSVALAQSLGMSLVIEGISSQALQDQVIALGATFAQGFHLAKPMSARRLEAWLH